MTDTIKLSPVDMSDISDIWVTGLPPLQLTSPAFKPQYPILGLSSVLLLTTLNLPCLDCQNNKNYCKRRVGVGPIWTKHPAMLTNSMSSIFL